MTPKKRKAPKKERTEKQRAADLRQSEYMKAKAAQKKAAAAVETQDDGKKEGDAEEKDEAEKKGKVAAARAAARAAAPPAKRKGKLPMRHPWTAESEVAALENYSLIDVALKDYKAPHFDGTQEAWRLVEPPAIAPKDVQCSYAVVASIAGDTTSDCCKVSALAARDGGYGKLAVAVRRLWPCEVYGCPNWLHPRCGIHQEATPPKRRCADHVRLSPHCLCCVHPLCPFPAPSFIAHPQHVIALNVV